MKTLSALLILAVLFPTSAPSQEKPKLPSREEVLKAIEIFGKSPLSAQGIIAAGNIATFAEESEEVTVIISPAIVPSNLDDKPLLTRGTLLVAYVAGNVKSQLERKTNANDSYAGVQQMLKTYAQLKEADKTLDIPAIQKFVDLEAKTQLKKYVEDALKEDEKKSAK